MTPPPDLPYAPKRTRPLSLWNPVDYLTLLYWVFYFPQAIRWYVETFGSTDWREPGWRAVRSEGVLRNLALQSLSLTLTLPFIVAFLLRFVGVEVSLLGVMEGMLGGGLLGMGGGAGSRSQEGSNFSLSNALALAIAGGIAGGLAGGVFFNGILGILDGLAVGIAIGLLFSITPVMLIGSDEIITMLLAPSILFVYGLFFSLGCGLVSAMMNFLSVGVVDGLIIGMALGVATGFMVFRFDGWLASLLPALVVGSRICLPPGSRVSSLPLPRLQTKLRVCLAEDWLSGIRTCEGILRYSMQVLPVIAAIRYSLNQFPVTLLLYHLVEWVSMEPSDWDAVRYQSADFPTTLEGGGDERGGRYYQIADIRSETNLRFDTPPRAACAAFWLLHEKRPTEAANAFAHVRSLTHGEELFANARAMGEGVEGKTLEAIATWQAPPDPPDEVLRPTVREALLTFGRVAEDVGRVLNSRSKHQRNAALSRATGALTDMLGRLEEFPTPERDNLETIAQQWREILLSHATEVGTLEVREAVTSPYIVGAIVPPERLVGRADIFSQLQAAWAKPGPRESLVIYGHRRMGKSSIARALLHFCHFGEETGLAVLNLQAVDWSGGMAYLAHAIAFELWRALPTALPTPSPDDFAAHPVPTLRGWLAELHAAHPARRYLLILDEYELLEEKLLPDAARAFSTLLRGLTQQEPWLAVALVGLHTLQERSADIYHELFAWRTLPVGFMDEDAVADALQVEHEEFPLEYDLDAISRAHHLTGGQPFLVQLMGDSLVQRFNQRLRHDLTPPAPRFSAADVDAVTSAATFFEQGDAYFRGIWAQAGQAPEGQHALLRALAPHPDGLNEAAWQAAATLDADSFAQAKEALARHDVIVCTGGTCRYTVELLRRWVGKVEG